MMISEALRRASKRRTEGFEACLKEVNEDFGTMAQ